MQRVLLPRYLLQLSAQPALESFYEQSYVACLDPDCLEEYIQYLLHELTDSTLLMLSLFTWEVSPSAFSHTYSTWTPIKLSPSECALLAESVWKPGMNQNLDLFYRRYSRFVERGWLKRGFKTAIGLLSKRLDLMFLNLLEKAMEKASDE